MEARHSLPAPGNTLCFFLPALASLILDRPLILFSAPPLHSRGQRESELMKHDGRLSFERARVDWHGEDTLDVALGKQAVTLVGKNSLRNVVKLLARMGTSESPHSAQGVVDRALALPS